MKFEVLKEEARARFTGVQSLLAPTRELKSRASSFSLPYDTDVSPLSRSHLLRSAHHTGRADRVLERELASERSSYARLCLGCYFPPFSSADREARSPAKNFRISPELLDERSAELFNQVQAVWPVGCGCDSTNQLVSADYSDPSVGVGSDGRVKDQPFFSVGGKIKW